MRARIFFVLGVVAATCSTLAQPSSSDVISRPPATNGVTGTPSLPRIATTLGELHQVVEKSLPLLTAVIRTNTTTGPAGDLGTVVGGILNGDSGQRSDTGSRTERTNLLTDILRGVLGGTNSSAQGSASSNTISDLAVIRDHLEAMRPILERLDQGTTSIGSRNSSTNTLTPTGREETF